jgi:hypothetical protein
MTRILMSILFAWLACPVGSARAEEVPRFEPTPCRSFDLDEEGAECGFLIVPENRDDPGKRILRLAVAILKSRSASPHPDPVIYLHGGPGEARSREPRAGWITLSARTVISSCSISG